MITPPLNPAGLPNPEVWLDASLSHHLPSWFEATFGVKCRHLLGIGLRESFDADIFAAAKAANVVFITKDTDYIALSNHYGPPPFVVLLTCGNLSNDALQAHLAADLPAALQRALAGVPIVELRFAR